MIKIILLLLCCLTDFKVSGNLEALQNVYKTLLYKFDTNVDYDGAINSNLARGELPIFSNSTKVIV